MNDETRTRILFLCMGNVCRSQMAEGWARELKGGRLEARSAGAEPHGLDPPALARSAADEEEALDHDRRVRDEIRRFVESLPESLPSGP